MHDPRTIATGAVHDGMSAAAVLNDSFAEASPSQKGRSDPVVRQKAPTAFGVNPSVASRGCRCRHHAYYGNH
jgi:hypothetical protein